MNANRMIAAKLEDCPVHKISAKDTNKFVLLCDGGELPFMSCIEIFDVDGRTPDNEHATAYEYFYIISGEGVATVGDVEIPLQSGARLVVPPGMNHKIINTGKTKLYCLTTMIPNEHFAELILSGPKAELDAEDYRVLQGR